MKCPDCDNGRVANPDAATCDSPWMDCETCKGTGEVFDEDFIQRLADDLMAPLGAGGDPYTVKAQCIGQAVELLKKYNVTPKA